MSRCGGTVNTNVTYAHSRRPPLPRWAYQSLKALQQEWRGEGGGAKVVVSECCLPSSCTNILVVLVVPERPRGLGLPEAPSAPVRVDNTHHNSEVVCRNFHAEIVIFKLENSVDPDQLLSKCMS